MHHCFFSHGLRTVFLRHGGRSRMNTTRLSRGPPPDRPAGARSNAGAPPVPHYRLRQSNGLRPSHPTWTARRGVDAPPVPPAPLRRSVGGGVRPWPARPRALPRWRCPPPPSAALSRMRARVTLRVACVPLCSRASSCWRSSLSSVTRYFFLGIAGRPPGHRLTRLYPIENSSIKFTMMGY